MLSRPMINEYGNCSGDSGGGEWAGGKGGTNGLVSGSGFSPHTLVLHYTYHQKGFYKSIESS